MVLTRSWLVLYKHLYNYGTLSALIKGFNIGIRRSPKAISPNYRPSHRHNENEWKTAR